MKNSVIVRLLIVLLVCALAVSVTACSSILGLSGGSNDASAGDAAIEQQLEGIADGLLEAVKEDTGIPDVPAPAEPNPGSGEKKDVSGFRGSPYSQENIVGLWRCTLKESKSSPKIMESKFSPKIIGYLRFAEDGSLAFDFGDGYGPECTGMAMYRGIWHVDADMGSSSLPAPLVVDLSLDSAAFTYNENTFPHNIKGVYSFVIENDRLLLTFVDGGNLYKGDGEAPQSYDFERDSSPEEELRFWKMSDSELTEYVNVYLYLNYGLANANAFYPIELNKWEAETMWFGFAYDAGDKFRYLWLNATTGEIKITDEVEDYTREGQED